MRIFLFSAVLGALGLGLGLTSAVRAADEAADKEQPALITVNVPQDAQIWFEGAKTSQEGTSRQFISPALKSGHNYTYTLRVRRWENGRNVDETRKLSVHAGENVTVSFGGNLQTNYYYSPAAASSPNGITYRNYYPSSYAPGYYYDSGYYPNYSPGYFSGSSAIQGMPDRSEYLRWGATRD